MEEKDIVVRGILVKVRFFSAIVAGSGAAGFNAADTLLREGMDDVAMICESVQWGTSRNAGSDKQTYYKLSLAGEDGDSVRSLARTLFSGQSMDGDIALCEAAASASCFSKLAMLGVPVPQNRYGEYVGYKTDHDPARRATSAGPYTSKLMTEALEKSARERGLQIFEGMQIIKLIVHDGKVLGVLCFSRNGYVLFRSSNIVWATGGPASMYGSSVYPASQNGATGIAFEAGAAGRGLTEWQNGLASLHPRWNVSGTYMQVLPRFVSSNRDGSDAREFLADFFTDHAEMLSLVFLKGYQWPFDVRKLPGSSLIDLAVFMETTKGRRVFLDFTKNPLNADEVDYSLLSAECRGYLGSAGACFGTPIQRLMKMNKPAVDFYLDKGVDLNSQMLEIAVCVQHNNGGLAVDSWWRSNIEGFFPVGEAAGTHGVFRPGGSALNAGQTGSFRAAVYIARKRRGEGRDNPELVKVMEEKLDGFFSWIATLKTASVGEEGNVRSLIKTARERMSLVGGMLRDGQRIKQALVETGELLESFHETVRIGNEKDMGLVFRLKDIIVCQYVYLSAMYDYISRGGKSRGGALYHDANGEKPHSALADECRMIHDDGAFASMIQEIVYKDGRCKTSWREAKPIPESDDFFENVWNAYRESGGVIA